MQRIFIVLAVMIFGTQISQAQITLPADKLKPTAPVQQLQPHFTETQKRVIQESMKARLYPSNPMLQIFVAPPSAFCTDPTIAPEALGVVTIPYLWRPNTNPPGLFRAAIIISTGAGRQLRIPVNLRNEGGGEAMTDTNVRFSRTDLCPSLCVNVQLIAADPADGRRVDQHAMRACVR